MTATTHEDLHSPQLQQDASEQHKPTSPWMWIALIVAMFASAIDEHDIAFLCGPWAETLCDLMGWDYGACRSYAALSKPERCTLIHTYRVVKGH